MRRADYGGDGHCVLGDWAMMVHTYTAVSGFQCTRTRTSPGTGATAVPYQDMLGSRPCTSIYRRFVPPIDKSCESARLIPFSTVMSAHEHKIGQIIHRASIPAVHVPDLSTQI